MILWHLFALCLLGAAAEEEEVPQNDGEDLLQYSTLPDFRVTKWNITYHDRSAVSPGYWFTAPYWSLSKIEKNKQYIPYQVGPYIFDEDGVLVWAGSAESNNRMGQDFRVTYFDADGGSNLEPHLSFMQRPDPDDDTSNGRAVLYNNQYNLVQELPVPRHENDFHEFNMKNPPEVLMVRRYRQRMNLADLGLPSFGTIMGMNGFVEVNAITGEETFRWSSAGKISLDESYVTTLEHLNVTDFLHPNSVDKTENGDYLLSGRHTYAIYLISGHDGHVIWRLGGKRSDFEMDFEFSGQHNPRTVSENSTSMVISIFNNGALHVPYGDILREKTSSALYVELDLENMKATVLKQFMRPDGQSSDRRGSVQTLPNGNAFVCWSDSGYITEFAPDGRLLMEAKYASGRFGTYRAYKFPWVGRPSSPPTLVAQVYSVNGTDETTLFDVSWNGATDIEYWRFYARDNSTGDKEEIGTVPKRGFETSFMSPGYMDWVSVEALSSDLEVLGASSEIRTPPPAYEPPGVLASSVEDTENPVDSKLHIGTFVGSFIAGMAITIIVCVVAVWKKVLVKYATSSFAWIASGRYSSTQQEDLEGLKDSQESLQFINSKERESIDSEYKETQRD